MKNEKIYVGLDIGTNSVGYAVTNEKYDIRRFRGEPAWGSCIFDEGSLSEDRRGFRTARRRLDRRKQRIVFLKEFFAEDINKVDPDFYKRLKESALFGEDSTEQFSVFSDNTYTDVEYHKDYPTIHHLIKELMDSQKAHDVRLVYLACAWLLSHRGHFLSNISMDNLSDIKDFNSVYDSLMNFFEVEKGCDLPWQCSDIEAIGNIIKGKKGVLTKTQLLKDILYDGEKLSKEISDTFPYSREGIVKLLAGGSYKIKDLFGKEEYEDFGSISLGMDDEKLLEISGNIGEDFDLIVALRSVYDWATLVDVLGTNETISEAKVLEYDKHKADLRKIKKIIKNYKPENYDEIFRKEDGGKYGSYVKGGKGTLNLEDFSKYLLGVLKGINANKEDEELYKEIVEGLELRTFLPKQKNTNNRVIPHQLYRFELERILDNAQHYLTFLSDADENGLTVKDKIISIFMFKIPYFVGPLNEHSEHSWVKKHPGAEGKIYPWNFEKIVDLDASEQEFIRRMTNVCTYLPGEDVLPKGSLAYQKFIVLNEINNIKIGNDRISVDVKQGIYNNLFMNNNKVTKKKIVDYMLTNGILEKGMEESVSGIDTNLNGSLSSYKAFKRLLDSNIIAESDAERIIERSTYSEDKSRLKRWLDINYPNISEEDRKYICGIKLKDFGRLSMRFLTGVEGCKTDTGEVYTILGALWNTQSNLMEIIETTDFTFKEEILNIQREYYENNRKTLADRLDDMYISNAVRRPIYRTMAILKDIEKAFGKPDKIFVEMARGEDESRKGKRTNSRLDQILELYKLCDEVEVRELKHELEKMGDAANNMLQSDKLFLYYMQLGRCMYSGEPIRIEELRTKLYDIDHIYPQAYVTDDSIINNKVLVLSKLNGEKSDTYPIASAIRSKMSSFWKHLYDTNLISETKYKRLVRSTPFTEEEKLGFISRQYVETTQATKAVAKIIGEKYPEAEIVYCKAKIVSEFRHLFDIYKCRSFNDLHHAVDAYLNIVTGNVYNMKFTKKWFNVNQKYSVNPKTVFTHEVKCGDQIIWDGTGMLEKVKKQAVKNNAHFVKYSYFKHGGFFDQMPVAKAEGLVPRKAGLSTDKYGGYNKAGVMFYIPVRYVQGKKSAVIIMSVELLHGNRFLSDEDYAREYSFDRLKHILGKPVDDISFPMGMRPWKVNTVLSLDGFRVCITGIGSGGKALLAQPIMQYSDSNEWKGYLKKLEKFCEKIKTNSKYVYDRQYDGICCEKNIELYDRYIDKYKKSIYRNRINSPLETLESGRNKFVNNCSVIEQANALLNIHKTFGRESASGMDLSIIGGTPRGASTASFSSTLTNWSKKYRDVRVVNTSPSGIWENISDNLLELI